MEDQGEVALVARRRPTDLWTSPTPEVTCGRPGGHTVPVPSALWTSAWIPYGLGGGTGCHVLLGCPSRPGSRVSGIPETFEGLFQSLRPWGSLQEETGQQRLGQGLCRERGLPSELQLLLPQEFCAFLKRFFKKAARRGDLLALERLQPFVAPDPRGRRGGQGMVWGQAGWVAPGVRVTAWPARSAANVKKWEMELQTLRESNARLTTALQESAASLEQWKRQFSVCRDENDRLRNKVGAGAPGVPVRLTCPAALPCRSPHGRKGRCPCRSPHLPTFPEQEQEGVSRFRPASPLRRRSGVALLWHAPWCIHFG